MIQLQNVHKVYDTKEGRVHAVNDVTLQIHKVKYTVLSVIRVQEKVR